MSLRTEINVNDFFFTYYGDIFSDYGDILDTFHFEVDHDLIAYSLKQEIITRVESYSQDWQLHPEFNTNLRDYIGTFADIKYVMVKGKEAITRVLVLDGLLLPSDFSITPLQVGATSILYVMLAKTAAGTWTLNFNYDLNETKFRYVY